MTPAAKQELLKALRPRYLKATKAEKGRILDEFVAANCKGANVSHKILVGKHYEEILKMADKWGADLIVVYHNHRRDINEVFSGSCSARVMEHANCSVLRLRNVMS